MRGNGTRDETRHEMTGPKVYVEQPNEASKDDLTFHSTWPQSLRGPGPLHTGLQPSAPFHQQ